MKKNTISACLVVYNEEEDIEACLENIKEVVDEIIVVHDGPCKDATIKIAKKYTSNIFIAPKSGGSAQVIRPFSFKQANGDWILIIDADERLSFELKNNLRNLVDNEDIDAYRCPIPLFDHNGILLQKNTNRYTKRLFRRIKMYQIGLPHSQTEVYGRIKTIDLILEHHPRSAKNKMALFWSNMQKNLKRSKVTAKYLSGDLNKIPTYNCSIFDKNLKQKRKYLFQRKYPFLALFVLPTYSFVNRFFYAKYYEQGYFGFENAFVFSLFHFFTCFFIIKNKLFG